MATSLSQQLQRLAVPQTAALIDSKKKASILFDPLEAAKKDRRTIYELGVNGLHELIVINPEFQQFEETLFNEQTLHMERSVETSEVNSLLDKNIKKFMQHLSPYLLLRPCHMCLEWLLRRFQVNAYNRKELLALALPYHETNIFVRILQTMKLKDNDMQWGWMRPLQKPGVTLPKTVILNRAASDATFLKFVCESTMAAIAELGSRASTLQAQLNFYASVVVGALENSAKIQEWHVVTILPSLLKGLSSNVIDFASAAYIVTAQLVASTTLTNKLCTALISRVAAVSIERLRPTAVLLLIWIYDSQKQYDVPLSNEILSKMVTAKWLTEILSNLSNENTAIHALCIPLITAATKAIHDGGSTEETAVFKQFMQRLLQDIKFSNSTAALIIKAFLDAYVAAPNAENGKNSLVDGEIIELDSDEEMPDVSADFQSWYSDYLRQLEHQYPAAFDNTIKDALQSNEKGSKNRNHALKMALGYRLKSFDKNATDLYENLYHHTAKIRLYAIQTLFANLSEYQGKPQNYKLLKECLSDRLNDDNALVVKEVLKLGTQDFLSIMQLDQFVNALSVLLQRVQEKPEEWGNLIMPTLQHLTNQEILQKYDNNLILLNVMPFLFPAEHNADTQNIIKAVLNSDLAKKIGFLKRLELGNKKKSKEFNLAEFKKHFLDIIAHDQETPDIKQLFESVKMKEENFFKSAAKCNNFLILATAFMQHKLKPAEAKQLFEQMYSFCAEFEIKPLNKNISGKQCDYVVLQLYTDFLSYLIKNTDFELDALKQWHCPSEDLKCFMAIYQQLAEQTFSQQNSEAKLQWSNTLKVLFENIFENPQNKLEFLLNFFVHSELQGVDANDFNAMRIRAFKLTTAILQNKSNKLTLQMEHLIKIIIGLNSSCKITRLEVLQTMKILSEHSALKAQPKTFVQQLLERHEELIMDHEQLPLIMFTLLNEHKKTKSSILNDILKLLGNSCLQEPVFKAQILNLLKHLSDCCIAIQLMCMAEETLQQITHINHIKMIESPYADILLLIMQRFEVQNIENLLMDCQEASKVLTNIFNSYDIYMNVEDKLQPLPCVLLENLDEYVYERMSLTHQNELLANIIQTIAAAENDSIFLAANKLLRKCQLDCNALVKILSQMFTAVAAEQEATPCKQPAKRRHKLSLSLAGNNSKIDINSQNWKQGVALLELLENKKKLQHAEKLIPQLFALLQLTLDHEEQSAVEYSKQLTLSALLHCCRVAQSAGVQLSSALPKTTFRIDQIVQCMRATKNPQTHHNALLLLSHCAVLFPQQVLHNIVDIFTFMGSSVVRHDDAFSFQIINNIIESIIPVLVNADTKQASNDKSNTNPLVVPVLKVFSDIMLDVPEHRRLPLYTKLMQTLSAEQYLWSFLCVVFESHVIDHEKQSQLEKQKRQQNKKSRLPSSTADKLGKRIEFALELSNTFAPHIILETCIQLLQYIKQLPMHKNELKDDVKRKSFAADSTESSLFNVTAHSDKQLRHYKYTILQFLSNISSCNQFLRKIAVLSEEDLLNLKPYYQNFIIRTLGYVPVVSNAIEHGQEDQQIKTLKIMLHHVHTILDNAISLLSPDMFLVVIYGLMQHKVLSIRKKVIELLINKLQQKDGFFEDTDEQHFANLLEPLAGIVAGILQKHDATSGDSSPSSNHSHELVYLQQTALIALKLLSKTFALKYIAEFKDLLSTLTTILRQSQQISKIILATVILTMIEISSNLKAHSLAYLSKYMPQLVEVLQDQVKSVQNGQTPDNVCTAIIAGMQKLFEALPLFLGPYLVGIISSLSSIHVSITKQNNEKDQRSANALHKIQAIWSKIASDVPVRTLVPATEKSYKMLMSKQQYADIGMLMKLLLQAIQHASNTDLTAVQMELSNFFLHALEFRLHLKQASNISMQLLNQTEDSIIDAFVAWVLKLSESSFRPLYHKTYEWALKRTNQKQTILTYFLLTNKIAEALKSLFVLFANDFIEDAARLLNENNSTTQSIETEDEQLSIQLIQSILNTLHTVFLHDSKGFVNAHRFEYLMPAIVNQLENKLVLENEDTLAVTLTQTLAQLAVTVSSDILWKQLNYQVLLKTRTNVPEVRILAFNTCVEIARKLGEEFTPLLPETVPFIAELFEDENPRVEKNTRKSVQELEVILGESIQQHL